MLPFGPYTGLNGDGGEQRELMWQGERIMGVSLGIVLKGQMEG